MNGSLAHRVLRPAMLVASLALVTACSGSAGTAGFPSASAALSADPASDALARILDRGTLVLSTDLEYPPQSFAVEGAERAADTACAPNQLTAPEVAGFDAETGKTVASKLGVEPCFVAVQFTVIIGGGWADRWDIAWGSGALTDDRMSRLYVTQPYYALPNYFFVRSDSTYTKAADLDGLAVGACAGCTHELYLKGELKLPGPPLEFQVKDAEIVLFDAEPAGLEDLAGGGIEAFLGAESVGAAAIDSGLALRKLPAVAFSEQETGYLDRSSGLDQAALFARVDEIIRGLHADGVLKGLSEKYFGVDYTAEAAAFDMSALDQTVE